MTVSPQCDEGFAFRNGTDHLILADLQDPGFSMSGLAIVHSSKMNGRRRVKMAYEKRISQYERSFSR